jgi:hypothetical protein
MIKSKITGTKDDNILDYPKLMISEETDRVVLFSKDGCGVDVGGDKYQTNGMYRDSWDMGCFKDFHGTVELSNDE